MLRRLIIPVLTFFKSDGKLDIKSNLEYVNLLNNSPFKKIILLGSTSEGMLISLKDKMLLLDIYTSYLKKDIEIFVAPSVFSIHDFVTIANFSPRIKNILFLPNCYFNRKEGDLLKYMKKLFKQVVRDKDLYIYNLPKNTNVNITPNDIKLFKKNNLDIKGIKLSHSNLMDINLYKSIENFVVMFGSDKDVKTALSNGADYVVAQSLSPIFFTVTEDNYIDKINYVRNYIKNNSDVNKIFILKKILNSLDNRFPIYTLT